MFEKSKGRERAHFVAKLMQNHAQADQTLASKMRDLKAAFVRNSKQALNRAFE